MCPPCTLLRESHEGCPLSMTSRLACWSELHFVSGCAADFRGVSPTCCGFRFRRQKKIGWRAPRKRGPEHWTRSAGRFVWRGNMDGAGKDRERAIEAWRPKRQSSRGRPEASLLRKLNVCAAADPALHLLLPRRQI